MSCGGGPPGAENLDEGGAQLTGSEDGLGHIVGDVTIGPLCPVETIPPDPACQPTAETFALVQIIIRNPAGGELRRVELDAEGAYAVELEAGTYLVDAAGPWLGSGGGGEGGGEDSVGSGGGGIEPDSGYAEPDTVIVEPDSGYVIDPFPGDSGIGWPGDSGRVWPPPDSVIVWPPDDSIIGWPPSDTFPPPTDSSWPGPMDTLSVPPPGVVPGDSYPSVTDSVRPDDGDGSGPDPLPFFPDPVGPDERVPGYALPVTVELAAGETERVDIDIDTGIR